MLSLLAALALTESNLLAQQNRPELCRPVARLIGESNRPRLVCASEWVKPIPNRNLSLLCFETHNRLAIQQRSLVSEMCLNRPLHNSCAVVKLWECSIERSAGTRKDLVYPLGSVHRNLRPALQWQPLQQATLYRVEIPGLWVRDSQTPTLVYPKNEIALKPGNTYQIRITAFAGELRLSTQTYSYIVLPQDTLAEINSTLQQLKDASDAETLALQDLQALYLGYGLWDDAIKVLNTRISEGSQNPALYRTLGDRLLELNLSAQAGEAYNRAVTLANGERNANERLLALRGLEEVAKFKSQPTP